MAKSQCKLVTEFPISAYRCGARAGERVRLLRKLVIRDHKGKPIGKVHSPGEIWCVVRGAAEEPQVLWVREPDGRSHTWDDNDNFWGWFERDARRAAKLGSLLVMLALFLALPLPSKPGVNVQVVNGMTARAQVTVTRIDSTARHITFSLAPDRIINYRSAPGDYSESIQFVIEYGTFRLPVSVADLRQHQVRLTESEIFLADVRKD
jgi:hypothetical protein